MLPNAVLHVDKLRLCFLGPRKLAEQMEEKVEIKHRDFTMTKIYQSRVGCQFLVKVRDESSPFREISDELGTLKLGNILQSSPFSAGQYFFWFDVKNRQLYNSREGISAQKRAAEVARILGLTFYKLTYIELAADSPVNYLPRISEALSNPTMKVYTLGKAPDTRTDEYRGLNWEIWQSATTITNTALRIKNREKTMELYCYDKLKEIAVSGKTYILSANPTGGNSLWRYEIRLHGDALDEYLKKRGVDHTDLFPTDSLRPDLLADMYDYYAQRLIRGKLYRGTTLARKSLQFWEFPESAFIPLISIGGLNAH